MHADRTPGMLGDPLRTAWACQPVLGPTPSVGPVASVFQLVRQTQEMSLTDVPKLIATASLVFGPLKTRTLTAFLAPLARHFGQPSVAALCSPLYASRSARHGRPASATSCRCMPGPSGR